MILLWIMFGSSLSYGQSKKDSVLISISEAQKIALIINQNDYLKKENIVLDSLVVYSSKTIDLLKESLDASKMESEELKKNYQDCMTIDTIRQQEISAIEKQCKKEKRVSIIKVGGCGTVLGMIVMLLIL